MGYLSAPETDQLQLPSNPEYWVRMKSKASYGDSLAAQSAMLQLKPIAGANGQSTVTTEMELSAYMLTLTVSLLAEWNLTDESGVNVLPINEDMVKLLEPEDGEYLSAEAEKRLNRRPPEEQGPFPKRSGKPSGASRSKTLKLAA